LNHIRNHKIQFFQSSMALFHVQHMHICVWNMTIRLMRMRGSGY